MVGPSRHRDTGRFHPSGHSKRKAKEEKGKKEKEVLAKTPKLNIFFGASGRTSGSENEFPQIFLIQSLLIL